MLIPIGLRVMLGLWLASQPQTWHGSWSVNLTNSSMTLAGTWDATLADQPDTLTGNWSVVNSSGETVATGTWAMRKDQKVWSGTWSARDASGGVHSGTWRARTSLSPAERFAAMFDAALTGVVSGAWRMGSNYSGGWSIRAFAQ